MFVEAICVGNQLVSEYPGTSALEHVFRCAGLPLLADRRRSTGTRSFLA